MGDKGGNETTLTPGQARDVGKNMRKGAEAVRTSHFSRVDLADSTFSSLPKGVELAGEHTKSYAILSETIKGFELDLDDYGSAVEKCTDGLENTDSDSATMFNRMATIEPTGNDRQYAQRAWAKGEGR